MQLDGLRGRVALVTGRGRGIGLCIAETLRGNGAQVAAADLTAPEVEGVFAGRRRKAVAAYSASRAG